MRLINADALWVDIANNSACIDDCCPRAQGKKGVLALIEEAPIIEAELVKHGKWEYRNGDDYDAYTPRCFICGEADAISREDYEYRGDKIRDNDSNYCPNCGAKRDEEG